MAKTLVLIRHAHRDNTSRELDNGLTDRGREQARALKRFFAERYSPKDIGSGLWLVSSPKRRCLETMAPLAKPLDRVVDIHPDLDEQGRREDVNGLELRVQGFLREWTQGAVPLTVVCSHGDWIPAALFHLLGLRMEIKKGSWAEVEWDEGRAQLKWYIPSFKPFYS